MLMPKRTKWRKQMRGRIRGEATRGNEVSFGEFGLQALEPAWLSARVIEAGRVAAIAQRAQGEGTGGLKEDRIVHQGEGLQGCVRAVALDAGVGGIGRVEGGQHGVEHAAQGQNVQAAAVAIVALADLPFYRATDIKDVAGERRPDAGAADGTGEQAADGERGVAQDFRFEAQAVLAGEQAVERVEVVELGPVGRGLAVGGGGDDAADELLAAPAAGDEVARQPVEQFRVRGRLAGGAEVVGRGDQAGAEEFAPDVIDGDAGGQRVVRRDKPAGEVEAAGQGLGGCRHGGQGREAGRQRCRQQQGGTGYGDNFFHVYPGYCLQI
jgi:hypothetical protein